MIPINFHVYWEKEHRELFFANDHIVMIISWMSNLFDKDINKFSDKIRILEKKDIID